MNNFPNFSIIIPHKNTINLLIKCLQSIPKRHDLEIIVVDDDSNEEEKQILKKTNKSYENLTIIYLPPNDSKGAGHARNIGLKNSRSKWVIFADSDDTFNTIEFNIVLDKYANSNKDIIYFNINCLDANTNEERDNANKVYINYIEAKDDMENKCRYKLMVPWGKFVKRKLINDYNISFDETRVGNDAWFSLQTGFYASQIEVCPKKIYNWMVRSGSITSNKSIEALLIHFNLGVKLNTFKELHKLEKYRHNLFTYIPMLIKSGISPIKATIMCITNTPKKFIFGDTIQLFKLVLSR